MQVETLEFEIKMEDLIQGSGFRNSQWTIAISNPLAVHYYN